MNNQRPFSRALRHSRTLCACAALCVSSLFAALPGNAQDIAEAARQEKARKAAQQKPPAHVYTNEDLQHSQILTPEDRTIVEARKKHPAPPAEQATSPANAPAPDVQEAAASESLGEIARRLRLEKAARQAEQARKLPQPTPFPLDMPHDATLAHPKPLSSPLVAPTPAPRKLTPPTVSAGAVKRNPFSRAMISAAPRAAIIAPTPRLAAPSVSAPSTRAVMPPVAATVPVVPSGVSPASPVNANHPEVVRIQSGDSLWNLSRRYLGKGSRWQEWLNRNPEIGDPLRLQPGTILRVPTGEAAAMHVTSESTLSVQSGDSLWRIAARHFGSGAAWPCLAHANPNLQNVSLIYPGQTLQLPASCAAVTPVPLKN